MEDLCDDYDGNTSAESIFCCGLKEFKYVGYSGESMVSTVPDMASVGKLETKIGVFTPKSVEDDETPLQCLINKVPADFMKPIYYSDSLQNIAFWFPFNKNLFRSQYNKGDSKINIYTTPLITGDTSTNVLAVKSKCRGQRVTFANGVKKASTINVAEENCQLTYTSAAQNT